MGVAFCAVDDMVSLDRRVLLASFKLENILRGELFGKVMTLCDLKSEENMGLLRQSVSE